MSEPHQSIAVQAFHHWWRRISTSNKTVRKPPALVVNAFAEGWNAAVEKIMTEAVREVRTAVQSDVSWPSEVNEKRLCDTCQKRPSMHWVGTTRQCCECYVKAGHAPADWHPLCMTTYRKEQETADASQNQTT